jgi:hypothetical protein
MRTRGPTETQLSTALVQVPIDHVADDPVGALDHGRRWSGIVGPSSAHGLPTPDARKLSYQPCWTGVDP